MRFFLLMMAVLAALLMPSANAWAHAFVDRSNPGAGEVLSASPATVTIWFTDDLTIAKSGIAVTDSAGRAVDQGDSHGDPKDAAVMSVSLQKLASGTYTVKWHATCSSGHRTSGSFEFKVK